jgi:hypothetical protein
MLVLLIAFFAVVAPETARATGSFALESVQATVCAPIEFDLTTTNPGGGLGFDFRIAFNRNLIDVTDVALTSYTDSNDCSVAFNDPSDPGDPDFGFLVIALACKVARSGSGTVATITASPVANGTTALTFADCDVDEQPCAAATAGSVQVSCFPTPTPTPVPTVTPTPAIPCTCQGDSNKNGFVNFADYGSVAANFGQGNTPGGVGDANCNGFVNFADYGAVAANFGQACPAP